jgi:formylglycine-generating enzyme required for sulfatase activity
MNMSDHIQNSELPEAEKIEPIPFHASSRGYGRASRRLAKIWLVGVLVGLTTVLLSMAVWFVFTARQVSLVITPTPDSVVIQGGLLTPKLGGHYLLRPGQYELLVEKACFTPLQASFTVDKGRTQRFAFELQPSPGKLFIEVHQKGQLDTQSIPADVLVDGRSIGTAPITGHGVQAGRHALEIIADQYLPHRQEIEMAGCNKEHRIQVALLPGWAEVDISSIPEGEVSVDNRAMGRTPLKLKLLAGTHNLRIQAPGHKPWQRQLTVTAGEPVRLGDIRLPLADGLLKVSSTPAGATIMIGDRYAGQTPLTLELAPNQEHLIRFSKTGYTTTQQTVAIGPNERKDIRVRLKAEKGVVAFKVQPQGAALWVNGRNMGPVPEWLNLPALPHDMEFRLKGYQPYKTRVTPRPGLEQQVNVSLTPLATTVTTGRTDYKAGNGYPLVLIRPKPLTMGSSRREQGRRSNETLRRVRLTRPFLMGAREVTNREFRAYTAEHNSGAFNTQSLNRDDQPVVQVTWQQAARFCNWLSERDNLPKVYIQKGETLVAASPLPAGYRLPTEAEWEYSARYDGQQTKARYPWGNTFPPRKKSGNFGDESAKNLFSRYIEGYNDGYAVTAPPAQFQANALGLFDLGGNVAEWCHDVYNIYSRRPDKVYVDPTGPPTGELWVIRGSSWRDSSISELRSAFRGYGKAKRDDVGFRVCRYAQ